MLITLAGSPCAGRAGDRYAAWSSAVTRLREEWEQGCRPGVADLRPLLEWVPADQTAEAVQDLIAEHLRLSWRDGLRTYLEDYLRELVAELGEQADPARIPADLVEDEFLARQQPPHGDGPTAAEYGQRFPGRPDILAVLAARCLAGGRYVKLRLRGRGAMGDVWEAFDRQLDRTVALKQPRRGPESAAACRQRFAAGARVVGGLVHPGIVGVHELVAEEDGGPFYVMRLINGRALGELIRDYHQPPPDRAAAAQRLLWGRLLHAFLAVGDAVAFAHAHGVWHRDLKPSNVLVGDAGAAVIVDWDMACRGTSGTPGEPGAVVGTPEYMPPEQADGIAEARGDVFGLGAILYEILTGQPPHRWPDGVRPSDWPRRVREARFPLPRSVQPAVPAALEAVCLKALARVPSERYPSVAEFVHDARRSLCGQAVQACSRAAPAGFLRWLLRTRG